MLIIASFIYAIGYAVNRDFENAFNQGMNIGKAKQENAFMAEKNFNPAQIYQHYSESPTQTRYYNGIMQEDTTLMDQESIDQIAQTPAGNVLIESINNRPQYVIDPKNSDISHAILLEKESDNIIHGVTDHYIDCKSKQSCKFNYFQTACHMPAVNQQPTCQKNLIIEAKPSSEAIQIITLDIAVLPKHGLNKNITVQIDLKSGNAFTNDGTLAHVSVKPLLKNVPCEGLQINLLKIRNTNSNNDTQIQIVNPPSCSNQFNLTFIMKNNSSLSDTRGANISYQILAKLPPRIYEHWSNKCNYLEQLQKKGICQLQKADVCINGAATKVINGFPIIRSCWTMLSSYDCRIGAIENDCNKIDTTHCEQIGSNCASKVENVCISYQQTYRCNEQLCENTADIICGDGKDYCLEGNCTDHGYQPSQDFAKGMSAISAMADASKSFDTNFIFKGKPQQCHDDAGEFSNCCNQEGWGQDWHLAHCSAEEKSLGVNRQNGLTVNVGRYCAHHLPWPLNNVCLEHKESYCTFDSKLGRIIQLQGRRDQLNINFGDPEHPNCEGITTQQLQKIDLTKIDFSDFYADLYNKNKKPDINQINQKIVNHIQQYQQMEQPDG